MARVISIALACIAAAVAGCSSAPVQQQAATDEAMSCDYAYMSRIERHAREQRAELRWVNCPQARKAADKVS